MSSWKRYVPVGAVVALAVAVAVDPIPEAAEPALAVPQTFSVEPGQVPVVCPGPLEVPVGDIQSGDDELDAGSSDRTLTVLPSTGGTAIGEGTALDSTAGVSVERVGTGDIASLAGLACTMPAQDQWLVGGSTTLGNSSRLVLSNTAPSSVRASVTVYGPVGQVGDPVSVIVAPGGQEQLLIESIEPELPGIAVHVEAGGAGVSAALQDSRLSGFTAAGTDWVAPVPAISTDLVVPFAGPSSEANPGTLRLLSPAGAQVELTLLTPSGPQPWLSADALSLAPDTVTDLAIPEGDVTAVRITASAPVVAAAMVQTSRPAPTGAEGDLAHDIAWTHGQQENTELRAVVVPEGQTEVVVATPSSGTFILTDATGNAVVEAPVERGTVSVVPLDVPAGTVLQGSDRTSWVVRVGEAETDFVTTLTPRPVERPDRAVTVVTGDYSVTGQTSP